MILVALGKGGRIDNGIAQTLAMHTKQLRALLTSLPFSASLPERVVDELAAASLLVDFPGGATIFSEGAENHNLYLICEGRVALEMCVPARGCVRLMTLGPGDLVAWSALLGDGRMTATALALDEVKTIAASGPKLLALCEQDHEIGYFLMRRVAIDLSRRLVATRLQLLDLFSPATID